STVVSIDPSSTTIISATGKSAAIFGNNFCSDGASFLAGRTIDSVAAEARRVIASLMTHRSVYICLKCLYLAAPTRCPYRVPRASYLGFLHEIVGFRVQTCAAKGLHGEYQRSNRIASG